MPKPTGRVFLFGKGKGINRTVGDHLEVRLYPHDDYVKDGAITFEVKRLENGTLAVSVVRRNGLTGADRTLYSATLPAYPDKPAQARACNQCGRNYDTDPFGDACANCQYDDMDDPTAD